MFYNKTLHNILRNRYVVPHTPFYKRYPFHGSASVKSADDRGCIDFDLGIFYNRTPKAANSTIVSSLVQAKLGTEIASPQAKKVFRSPSTLSNSEVKALDGLFKFALVRDPFSRTLSAYLDKIDRKYNQKEEKVSFKDFLKNLKQGKLHSNLHWAPQTSIMLLPIKEFDFIGKFENLNQDLNFILSRITQSKSATPFINNDKNFHRKGPPSTSASDKVKNYYDDECEELVKQLFALDFQILEYPNHIIR